MSMQVDCATALYPDFEICEGNLILSEKIFELSNWLPGELGRWKYGSEHPCLDLTLCHLAWKKQAKRFLEVGYECGGTTIPLSHICKELGGTYRGLDCQESPFCNKESIEFIRKHVVGDVELETERGFDTELLEGKYDFVFFDHHKPLYQPHLQEMVEGDYLEPGAWVFFHDVDYFRLTSGESIQALEPVRAYVEDNDLGECHYLRQGWNGVTCPDLGVFIFSPTDSENESTGD